MKEKRKIPVLSVIFIVLGVGLILFGIIFPQVKFGWKNSFDVETDRWADYTKYEVKIKTKATLDLNSGVFEIDNDDYPVVLTLSDDDDYQYEFELTVPYEWGTNRLDDGYDFRAKSTSGKEISFSYNDGFMTSGLNIFSTIAPIMFGVVLLFAGVGSAIVLSKSRKVATAVSTALVGTPDGNDSGILGAVKERISGPQQKSCKYCGCENNPQETKCTSCGAPLKKK